MTEITAASIAAFAMILVWYLTSRDLSRKEKENKRREIRLNYLIDAYRKLESAGNRPMTPESQHARNIESAIADIQLFGSPRQDSLRMSLERSPKQEKYHSTSCSTVFEMISETSLISTSFLQTARFSELFRKNQTVSGCAAPNKRQHGARTLDRRC